MEDKLIKPEVNSLILYPESQMVTNEEMFPYKFPPFGMDYSNKIPPYTLNDPGRGTGYNLNLNTPGHIAPIYVKIYTPPLSEDEFINFYWDIPGRFGMLRTPFPNTQNAYVININWKPRISFHVVNTQKYWKNLELKIVQMNPEPDTINWCRLVEVPSQANPHHTIQFMVWQDQ